MPKNRGVVTIGLMLLLGGVSACSLFGDEPQVMVGGGVMMPTRNIIENVVYSNDHTTLVTAIRAAELVQTLTGPGPFTVFAPTNEAFEQLPPGTADALLARQNKTALQTILAAHVIDRKINAPELIEQAKKFKDKYRLKTMAGVVLTVSIDGGALYLTDPLGGRARIDIADVEQSNGVVHVINGVMIPKVLPLN